MKKREFGLYIHWPFCKKKCPYCDFNSYVFEHNSDDWADMLIEEIKQLGVFFTEEYELSTVFFGGGTPSLIPPKKIQEIIETVFEIWGNSEVTKKNVEITLETNPSSVESYDLEQFLQAGINRFSIGMQSLSDEELKFLGRTHNSNEAIGIISKACTICSNVSGDFIYALPKQNLVNWKDSLEEIIKLADRINLKHLSLYQLTIEPNTGFDQAVRTKKWVPMENDLQAELYDYTQNRLKESDWDCYEISNFAREKKYRSRHNLIYWKSLPYLGVGPGAHSRMFIEGKKYKFNDFKNPYRWFDSIKNHNSLENKVSIANNEILTTKEDFEELSEREIFVEKILMGFRLGDGIKISEHELQFLDPEALKQLIHEKYILVEGDNYSLSSKGRLRLDSILKFILL